MKTKPIIRKRRAAAFRNRKAAALIRLVREAQKQERAELTMLKTLWPLVSPETRRAILKLVTTQAIAKNRGSRIVHLVPEYS